MYLEEIHLHQFRPTVNRVQTKKLTRNFIQRTTHIIIISHISILIRKRLFGRTFEMPKTAVGTKKLLLSLINFLEVLCESNQRTFRESISTRSRSSTKWVQVPFKKHEIISCPQPFATRSSKSFGNYNKSRINHVGEKRTQHNGFACHKSYFSVTKWKILP